MEIENKTALITGGAGSIGFCTAQELLRNGAKSVAILDLSDSNGESMVAELENEFGKGRGIFFAADVAKDDEFTASFKKAVDALGSLDIVINNAGIMDDADWDVMIDINYKGVVRGNILALSQMGKHKGGKGGTIVNMSSIAGLEGNPIAPIYGGTKHAILGLSLALQRFYDKTGVRVLTICPGLTTTAMASRFMASKVHAMDILDDDMAAREMVGMQNQPPEHVACAIIELIEKGKNGAIFVSENNQPPYAVEIPPYSTFKVAV
ncbi:hypothetical protein KM043_007956 [Ampulex compressa]|nr:hypothetical protein KM043_007956 [Ampulex compressa]